MGGTRKTDLDISRARKALLLDMELIRARSRLSVRAARDGYTLSIGPLSYRDLRRLIRRIAPIVDGAPPQPCPDDR